MLNHDDDIYDQDNVPKRMNLKDKEYDLVEQDELPISETVEKYAVGNKILGKVEEILAMIDDDPFDHNYLPDEIDEEAQDYFEFMDNSDDPDFIPNDFADDIVDIDWSADCEKEGDLENGLGGLIIPDQFDRAMNILESMNDDPKDKQYFESDTTTNENCSDEFFEIIRD